MRIICMYMVPILINSNDIKIRAIVRTYVSPIGYNPTSVTRVLLSRGIEPDDTVVLLRPAVETDDSRAAEAINDVETMLAEIQPEITVVVERIPHDDFSSAVMACSDTLRSAEGELIVNLSGGARDVFLPFTVAALAIVERIDDALAFSDIDGQVRDVELPNISGGVSDSTRQTLDLIARAYADGGIDDRGISIAEISRELGSAKSTVSRHISQLADIGAVETTIRGKTKYARPTLTGRLLLRSDPTRE